MCFDYLFCFLEVVSTTPSGYFVRGTGQTALITTDQHFSSDFNLNSNEDRVICQYLDYHASRMYSETDKRAMGNDCFGV